MSRHGSSGLDRRVQTAGQRVLGKSMRTSPPQHKPPAGGLVRMLKMFRTVVKIV